MRLRIGDVVEFNNEERHRSEKQFYPEVGTRGVVVRLDYNAALIKWPIGSTSSDGRWWCSHEWITKVEEELNVEEEENHLIDNFFCEFSGRISSGSLAR